MTSAAAETVNAGMAAMSIANSTSIVTQDPEVAGTGQQGATRTRGQLGSFEVSAVGSTGQMRSGSEPLLCSAADVERVQLRRRLWASTCRVRALRAEQLRTLHSS